MSEGRYLVERLDKGNKLYCIRATATEVMVLLDAALRTKTYIRVTLLAAESILAWEFGKGTPFDERWWQDE